MSEYLAMASASAASASIREFTASAVEKEESPCH